MGSLELDIADLCRPGRRAQPLTYGVVRELRASDLLLLAEGGEIKPPKIQRVSERHHALARLLAAGVPPFEAGAITGYQASRVSILQGDPAFGELVEFYRGRVDEQFLDTMSQIAGLSQDLLMELRERLEAEPESFSVGQLQNLLTATLDRSGYGPTSKQITEVRVDLAARLEAGRRRALDARRGLIRDITPPAEAAE